MKDDSTVVVSRDREDLPLLAGRYRLLEPIGTGGVADVWRAVDERLDRDVAVKIVHGDTDEAFRERFALEARRAAAISHPNVVTVYDAVADGEAFLVMELVRGRSLDEIVRERGHLPLREASRIVSQVAAALDAAHARGIVHCDVKPSNVLVDDHGVAKLADFGIARAAESAPERELLGTPRYLAPELLEGRPPTARSDVYGLGVLAYELVAEGGTRPLQAPVHHAIARARSRDPGRRFASAGEFAAALADAVESGPTTLVAATPARRGAPFDRRSLLTLAVVLLFGTALIAFFRAFGSVGAPFALPDVRRMSYEQAAAALSQKGLSVRREDRGAARDLGTGLEQRPGPSTQVRPGDVVTLVVAVKPTAPDVVGKSLSDAANALIAAGFKSPVNYFVDPNARGVANTVVRQDPPAGTQFDPGASATLYIVGPVKGDKGKGGD